ncbi:MAG: hypothetical protein U0841_04270 [Chloroflexia bacterium]
MIREASQRLVQAAEASGYAQMVNNALLKHIADLRADRIARQESDRAWEERFRTFVTQNSTASNPLVPLATLMNTSSNTSTSHTSASTMSRPIQIAMINSFATSVVRCRLYLPKKILRTPAAALLTLSFATTSVSSFQAMQVQERQLARWLAIRPLHADSLATSFLNDCARSTSACVTVSNENPSSLQSPSSPVSSPMTSQQKCHLDGYNLI